MACTDWTEISTTVNGFNIGAISENYQVLTTDDFIQVDALSGDITVTMFNASAFSGKVIEITKIDSSANNVLINSVFFNGSEQTFYLSNQDSSVSLVSDGQYWRIF